MRTRPRERRRRRTLALHRKHVQVIYIFHANTDGLDMLQQSAGAALKQGATFRAKV